MTSHRSSPRPHLPHLAWLVSALLLLSLLGGPATSAPPALTLHSPAPGALYLTWPATTPAPPAYHVRYAPADTPLLIKEATSSTHTLTLYDLEPGVLYTVQVRAGTGPWSVPGLQRIDDYRADPETVGTIGVGAEETGYIESAGDTDWFFIDLAAGEGYPIEVTGAPAPSLAVYDATGGVVQQGLAWHHAGALTFTPATAGLYHLAVGGPEAAPGYYTLTVDEPPTTGSRRSRTLAGATPTAAPAPQRATAAPAKPRGLTATATHDQVVLTWDDPGDASITGYVILRRVRENDTGGAFGVLVADTGSAATTYSDDTVSAETTYTYRIKAINEYGVSQRSRWFHIDIPAAPQATFVEGDDPDGEGDGGGAPGHATPPGPGKRANVSEPDGEDLPEGSTTTGEVDVGGSVTGNIATESDLDWFRVDLEAGKTYQFDLEGEDTDKGTLDTLVIDGIYNAAGGEIDGTYTSGGGEGHNARLAFMPTATGIYYVSVEGDGEVGTYTLSVREVDVPPTLFEEGAGSANDLPANAFSHGGVEVDGFGARGTIGVSGDIDWFQVVLEAGRTYRIDVKGAILTGPGTYADNELTLRLPEIVAIYDEDSTYLHHTSSRDATDDANRPHHLARVEFTPNAGGLHFIAATGVSFETGGYELTVIDVTDDADAHTANRSTTGTVDVGGSIQGKIDFSGDRDWFAVELDADTEYTFDLEGQATGRGSLRDPYLRGIYDANGNEIPGTRDDDGGEGNNARVTFTPEEAGIYYVAAAAFGYLEGTYMLSVSEVD